MGGKEHPAEGLDRRKKRERTNGLLAIELFSGDCFFQASKMARSEQVGDYMAQLAEHAQAKGCDRLEVFLDRNPTHKQKMQAYFAQKTAHLTIRTTFHLMAPYSPKLNLVEFAIHLIRQKILHHADHKTPLAEFQRLVQQICDDGKILSKDNIVNILCHIENTVQNSNYSPERE